MKYIKKFEKEADIMMEVQPNVVLAADTGKVSYNVPPLLPGVYVQHIDKNLYSEEEWTAKGFGNDLANGVAVITDNARFVIAKEDIGRMTWSSSMAISGVTTLAEQSAAKLDFDGVKNTQFMLEADTSKAGYSCANYSFPNGAKGYLPALGEWAEVYANDSKIKSMMTLIGGTAFVSDYYWSSTLQNTEYAWCWYCNDNIIARQYATATNANVRPFTTL